MAWKIWNIAHNRDRQLTEVGPGPIPSINIIALCKIFDATVDDFEKVLLLDKHMYKGPKSFMEQEDDKVVSLDKMKAKLKSKRKK